MKSHLLSQVVLRQFARNGLVSAYVPGTAKSTLKRPEEVAFINVDERIIGRLEQEWGQGVENDAGRAMRVLHDGGLLYQPKHLKTLKALIALHYVRSSVLVTLLNQAKATYGDLLESRLAGQFPAHSADIDHVLSTEWPDRVDGILIDILEENIRKVSEYLVNRDLEIGQAPASRQLIIGDVPVINIAGDGRTGIQAGVPINESTTIGMPLTPWHLVAITSDPKTGKYVALTPTQVDATNRKQRELAYCEYYCLPRDD